MSDEELDDSKVKPSEMLSDDLRAKQAESNEQENREPTLEEWAHLYAEIEGIEDPAKVLEALQSLQAEMSEDDRKHLTLPIYGKEGLTLVDAYEIYRKQSQENVGENDQKYFSGIKTKPQGAHGNYGEDSDKAFVAFARFSQEPDDDSLGDNAKGSLSWEETDEQFMSPKMYLLARTVFHRLTGGSMDWKKCTMFPNYRSPAPSGGVPYFGYNPTPSMSGKNTTVFPRYHSPVPTGMPVPGLEKVYFGRYVTGLENPRPYTGVRRVVSKELEEKAEDQ